MRAARRRATPARSVAVVGRPRAALLARRLPACSPRVAAAGAARRRRSFPRSRTATCSCSWTPSPGPRSRAMTRDRHATRAASSRRSRGQRRRRAHRSRRHRRPGRRRQLQRAVGRRSHSDADYDKTVAAVDRRVDGLRGLDQRRRHLLAAEDPRRRHAEQRGQAGADGTLDGADRDAQAARRAGLRRGPGRPARDGREGARARRRRRRRRRSAGRDGRRASRRRDRGRPRGRAQRHGIKPGDVRRAEATLLAGHPGRQHLRGAEGLRRRRQGVPATAPSVVEHRATCCIDGPAAATCGSATWPTCASRTRPSVIERDAVSRRIDVVADVNGRSVGDVADEVEDRLEAPTFPLEYHAEVLADSTAQRDRRGRDARGCARRRSSRVSCSCRRPSQLAPRGVGVPDAAGRARRRPARRAGSTAAN